MTFKLVPYSFYITIFFIFSSLLSANSQVNPLIQEQLNKYDRSNEIKNPDHIECVSYPMKKGDIAYFRTINSDSIVSPGEPPLLRQRIELYTLKCDSTKGNRIFYTQEMVEYVSMESKGYTMDVKREEHPWSQAKVHVEIDTMGFRYAASVADTSLKVMSPGGAFQPPILPVLDYGCRFIGEKWGTESEHIVPENGNPAPYWDEHLFYVMFPPKDTLGAITKNLEINRTGLCRMAVPVGDGLVMDVVNSKNSYGMLYFQNGVPVPVLQEITSENKMKIYGADEKPMENQHYYDTKIILEKYVNADNKVVYSNFPD